MREAKAASSGGVTTVLACVSFLLHQSPPKTRCILGHARSTPPEGWADGRGPGRLSGPLPWKPPGHWLLQAFSSHWAVAKAEGEGPATCCRPGWQTHLLDEAKGTLGSAGGLSPQVRMLEP